MITRADIAKHLEYGIRTGFLKGSREYTPLRSGFVGEQTSSGAFETYADLGDVPWPNQNAGKMGSDGSDGHAEVTNSMNSGRAITVLGTEERALTVYNVDWEISVAVTHNAINDARVGNLEQWARDAARNFEKHKDYLSFDALTQGAGSTYGKTYDGQVFFYASHADRGAEYTTAQSNVNTSVLSLDTFETVRVAGSKFKDSRGQPIGMNHTLLIVPPDLERVGYQITQNREDYLTANRALNPYSGSIRMLVAPGGWLDTTSWYLIDTSQTARPLYIQNRQAPQLAQWDDEQAGDGGVRYFKWHARYSVFYGDWRMAIQGNT
jgi:phage major head subunit gpT-like protein